MESTNDEDFCSVCSKKFEEGDSIDCVKAKGLITLISISKSKEDGKLNNWVGKSSIRLHSKCRMKYLKRKNIGAFFTEIPQQIPKKRKFDVAFEEDAPPSNKHCSASSELQKNVQPSTASIPLVSSVDCSEVCVLCGVKLDKRRGRKSFSSFMGKIDKSRFISNIKTEDPANLEDIKRRIENAWVQHHTFLYHNKCYTSLTRIYEPSPTAIAKRLERESAFNTLFEFIENSGNFKFTVNELHSKLGPHDCDTRTLINKLEKKFGDQIYIDRGVGRQSIVYYKTFSLDEIKNQWFVDAKSLGDLQKKTVLKMASDIISNEISSVSCNKDSYPASSTFLDDVKSCISPCLNYFLENLLRNKDELKDTEIKLENIAHSIMSVLRPRNFTSTLQLSVGTYIYRKTGSKLVIDVLSKLGITASYNNLRLFEASSIIDPPKMKMQESMFVQHVFDNTSHNVNTIDGKQTFQCLGGIACYTPHYAVEYENGSKRLDRVPKASVLAEKQQVSVVPYEVNNLNGSTSMEFIDVDKLVIKDDRKSLSPVYAGYIWAKVLDIKAVPSWKGFMENVYDDNGYLVSHVTCLPFINEPPSNLTTLNTALRYALNECAKMKQSMAFITCAEPLYSKLRGIVAEDESLNGKVTVRLGGFHLLMSFFGSVGYIMKGSGLEELWSTIYAVSSVRKMLAGHVYSRTFRAHILSFTAIGLLCCENLNEAGALTDSIQNYVHEYFSNWDSEDVPFTGDFSSDHIMNHLNELLIKYLEKAERSSPTAKLWVQYFKCIVIALEFVEAERLGDWDLHLSSIRKMLPIFHASGNFAYAKSAQIYLQDMKNLEQVMEDEEYQTFVDGWFTIRQSDKAWAGMWPDMVMKQTLNRFFDTDLKHLKSITPDIVARYLSAMPATVNIMDRLEDYCHLKSQTNQDCVDMVPMVKDSQDILTMLSWLKQHDLFGNRNTLISFSNGVVGGSDIDCHLAFEKGKEGMQALVGQNVDDVTLSKGHRVKNLSFAFAQITTMTDSTTDINPELCQSDAYEAHEEMNEYETEENGETHPSDLLNDFNEELFF